MKQIIHILLFSLILFSLAPAQSEEVKVKQRDYSQAGFIWPQRRAWYNEMVKQVGNNNITRYYVKQISLKYQALHKSYKVFKIKISSETDYEKKINYFLNIRGSFLIVGSLLENYKTNGEVITAGFANPAVSKSSDRFYNLVKSKYDVIWSEYQVYFKDFSSSLADTVYKVKNAEIKKRMKKIEDDFYCSMVPSDLSEDFKMMYTVFTRETFPLYLTVFYADRLIKVKKEYAYSKIFCTGKRKLVFDYDYKKLTSILDDLLKKSLSSKHFKSTYKKLCDKVQSRNMKKSCKNNNRTAIFLQALEKAKDVADD